MENEIEVNEYVRTKNGIIFKVDKDKNNLAINEFMNVEGDRKIKKHSKNLIDLIEPGDILVYQIKGLEHSTYMDIVAEYKDARTLKSKLRILNYSLEQIDIKSIVTKEQFDQVKYIVEE